jgi:NAD-dependent dihydropyrimidine dehydrogenase PreA subunit
VPPVLHPQECVGCGACEESCPLDVLYFDREKGVPEVRYPEECWHCGSCRQECPTGALEIRFPLRCLLAAGVPPY